MEVMMDNSVAMWTQVAELLRSLVLTNQMFLNFGRAAIGVGLALLSITLSSLGFVLQRKAHLLAAAGGVQNYRYIGIVGLILYLLATIPDCLAFALLPQIVCSVVESFRLVIMLIMAHALLNESSNLKDIIGVVACISGTILCIVYGPFKDRTEEVLFTNKVVVYLILGAILLVALVTVEHVDVLSLPRRQDYRRYTLTFTAALSFGLQKVLNTELGFTNAAHRHRPITWSAVAASIGLMALVNFYFVLRTAKYLQVRTSAVLGWAFGSGLQLFQSIAVLDEFSGMATGRTFAALSGACISFAGAFYLELQRVSLDQRTSQLVLDNVAEQVKPTQTESLREQNHV